jgi:hypothetical protein
MALFDNVKAALRITTTTFDSAEITPIINACKLDLGLAGVLIISDTDPLIERAVVEYAKANFGYSDESEKHQKAYEKIKNALALAREYGAYTITFTIKNESDAAIADAEITFNGETIATGVTGTAVFLSRQTQNKSRIHS